MLSAGRPMRALPPSSRELVSPSELTPGRAAGGKQELEFRIQAASDGLEYVFQDPQAYQRINPRRAFGLVRENRNQPPVEMADASLRFPVCLKEHLRR